MTMANECENCGREHGAGAMPGGLSTKCWVRDNPFGAAPYQDCANAAGERARDLAEMLRVSAEQNDALGDANVLDVENARLKQEVERLRGEYEPHVEQYRLECDHGHVMPQVANCPTRRKVSAGGDDDE